MASKKLILVEQICNQYEIDMSFINELTINGLIEIELIEETRYIHEKNISMLEKLIRLHHELDLNIEGLDVVTNLLVKIDNLKSELYSLESKLKFYEND